MRGYPTTGIKVAYIIDRLNSVLGLGGFRFTQTVHVRERRSRNGRVMFEAVCELVLQLGRWDNGQFITFAEASGFGGHVSMLEADARKGSVSNAIKKAASIVGCGWQAFAGRLDEENEPAEPAAITPMNRVDPTRGSKKVSSANGSNGSNANNGRITTVQLQRVRELVADVGGDWGRYREHVRGEHKVNVEYADRRLADQLIASLAAMAEKKKANGRRSRPRRLRSPCTRSARRRARRRERGREQGPRDLSSRAAQGAVSRAGLT